MNKTPFTRTGVALAVGSIVLMLGASQAFGTGFQLNEQSGSSIGNAFAAGAAFTDDASAMWWNPAALSKIPKVVGLGCVGLSAIYWITHRRQEVAAAEGRDKENR